MLGFKGIAGLQIPETGQAHVLRSPGLGRASIQVLEMRIVCFAWGHTSNATPKLAPSAEHLCCYAL